MEKFIPNEEQLAALQAYAARNGAQWKRKLADAWLDGRDDREPNGHLLRQMRNRGGPSWLKRFDLAKAYAADMRPGDSEVHDENDHL